MPLNPGYVLLLHCNGANGTTAFPDATGRHIVSTSGGAQVSTAQSKFGGGSGLFAADGDVATLDAGSDFAFGTGDFTIDFQFQLQTLDSGGGSQHFIDFRGASGTSSAPVIFMDNVAGGSTLQYNDANFVPRIDSGIALTVDGLWHHVAVTRSAGLTRLFFDGIKVGVTFADTTNYTVGTNGPLIGGGPDGAGGYETAAHGWIDEVRILKGVAAWTADFAPPTSPYDPNATLSMNAIGASFTRRVRPIGY